MIQCRNGGQRHSHITAPEARVCWAAVPTGSPASYDGPAPVGAYRVGTKIYRVVTRPNGNRRAEELHNGVYIYAKAMVYRLRPGDRLTLEQELEYGRAEHRCIRCGTRLTKKESQQAGIGPVCATKW